MRAQFCLLIAPLAALALEQPALTAAPNIVLILTDDQGYGEMSCHGNPILQTPNLDRLHAQGVRFTQFHVSPTCAPTRAALMTGRHEFRSGVTHTILERERLSLKAVTLAQVLKSAGYVTGIFGKWHLGDEPAYQPNKRGFDEVFVHGAGGIGQTYPGSCGDAPGNGYFDPAILHNGRFEKTRGYCTDVFFEHALRWMNERRAKGKPFFVYLTPNAPHDPFISPGPQYEQLFAGRGLGSNQVAYYSMIRNIDDNVGRLLTRLAEWGLERETLVIFMTDNGHSVPSLFNAGMRGAKGSPYEGGTRVPSFWRWPGAFPQGRDCERLTAHIDVLPTLAELAHARLSAKVGRQIEGRSLVPLLKDPGAPWPERLLFTHLGRWPVGQVADWKYRNCAVRDTRFKLVNHAELYDLQLDPGEKHNVIDAHPEVAANLRTEYERWWGSILPCLENEAVVGPPVNPFKARYWRQFGGGPDPALWRQMDPQRKFTWPKP